MMPDVATVKWKLAEFMREHDVTAYELAMKLGGHTKMSTAYRLADADKPPTRVDLETLGSVIKGLSEITNTSVQFSDLLEFIDD